MTPRRAAALVSSALLALSLVGCSVEPGSVLPGSPSASAPPSAGAVDVTLGAVSQTDGVLSVGTGTATFTLSLGEEARLASGGFQETNSVGIELRDNREASMRMAPQRAERMSAEAFADLLVSQGAASASALAISTIGGESAVAAETVDVFGVQRRVYLVWINGDAWSFTISAPTQQERGRLERILHTLAVQSALGTESDVLGGLDSGAEAGAESTIVSADGKLRGTLSEEGFLLEAPGSTLRFEGTGLRSISSDTQGSYIGVERDGVMLVFTVADERNMVDGDALARQLKESAEREEGAEPITLTQDLGEVTIGGHRAVGARIFATHASRSLYIIDTGQGFLAAMIQTPDRDTQPEEDMRSMLLAATEGTRSP